eukprot:786902-Rhodomonas_salina.1
MRRVAVPARSVDAAAVAVVVVDDDDVVVVVVAAAAVGAAMAEDFVMAAAHETAPEGGSCGDRGRGWECGGTGDEIFKKTREIFKKTHEIFKKTHKGGQERASEDLRSAYTEAQRKSCGDRDSVNCCEREAQSVLLRREREAKSVLASLRVRREIAPAPVLDEQRKPASNAFPDLGSIALELGWIRSKTSRNNRIGAVRNQVGRYTARKTLEGDGEAHVKEDAEVLSLD